MGDFRSWFWFQGGRALKRTKVPRFRMRAPGPSVSKALPHPPDSPKARNLQKMPESVPLESGLLKREASEALRIWVWGPEPEG